MSRSGYTDGYDDDLALGRWRGMVASAIRGKRGQKLLTDLAAALDAMPEKALIIGELETAEGEVCALGALGKARGLDMAAIDPSEPDVVAAAFDIAECLAQEIVWMNDENFDYRWDGNNRVEITPEERWAGMRVWVAKQIRNAGVEV
jgi:hypothetical protein